MTRNVFPTEIIACQLSNMTNSGSISHILLCCFTSTYILIPWCYRVRVICPLSVDGSKSRFIVLLHCVLYGRGRGRESKKYYKEVSLSANAIKSILKTLFDTLHDNQYQVVNERVAHSDDPRPDQCLTLDKLPVSSPWINYDTCGPTAAHTTKRCSWRDTTDWRQDDRQYSKL